MYEQFYGLNQSPFQLSPDPFFMFSSQKTTEALASISHAIGRRKGFVVMTGEVGTGKTLVLRCLFELWEHEQIPFAYFIGPKLSTNDFLSYITFELGIQVKEATKGNMLRALYGFLLTQFEKGLTTVLIIDEAQQMPRTVLEEIRVLANFETAQQKLVQVVLVGQPELEKRLDSVELRSLKQRIAVRCRLEPLGEEEIRPYVERRLELAGAKLQAASIFPEETIKEIYRYSAGIPRLVNSICDQALIAACARQLHTVPVEIINAVATHFRLDHTPNFPKRTDKSSALPTPIERPDPNKSGQAATTSSTSEMNALDPRTRSIPMGGSEGTPVSLEPETLHPKLTGDSSEVVTRETAGSKFDSGPTKRAPWKTQIRHWLEPGLRLSIVIITAGLLPVAMAAGFFMARRQKGSVIAQRPIGMKSTSWGRETRSVVPRGVGLAEQITVGSKRVLPPSESRSSISAGEREPAISGTKIVMTKLSRPIPRSLAHSAPAPPLSGVMQTNSLDAAKGLPELSVASPAPPEEISSGQVEQVASISPSHVSAGGDAGSTSGIVSGLQPAKLVSSSQPEYPAIARTGKVEGPVVIDAVVDETGRVADIKVVSGSPLLVRAAADALHRWKYEPARLNGRPVMSQVQVTFNFTLR